MSGANRSPDDLDSSLYERTIGDETSPTVAIIESLATIEDVDPTEIDDELDPSFHRCFDVEALNDIVDNVGERGGLRLDLFFDCYRIRITDGGRIRIWDDAHCFDHRG